MITEDYVSFKTAKLLKEKGFNEICVGYYNRHGRFDMTLSKVNNIRWEGHYIAGNISAPTHQMVMKWLRDVHKLHITIKLYGTPSGIVYAYEICKLEQHTASLLKSKSGFENNENACESAIEYCLTNLI